ncbi:diaminopimelate decarboxylase [Cytobacillus oceanisediminis]|uniref:diaminopimelate decarboxylase n=1 Tax=Cytobacillus oceanisediminis TaxID=665099 RepID=UPI0020791F31|nr:diaminopimelate decarboxylase [Cytobacillus oceanisediminis]USK44116.1 diaminopimelate decarboxylase [Cytobacillus oceanisediminis]
MEHINIHRIAQKYGTPFYVYDADNMISNFEKMRSLLNQDTEIYLSLKANPLLGLSHLFSRLGSGAEVASLGELKTALRAGFKPEKIIFSGPGKKNNELEYAIEKNIYCIIAESLEEIRFLSKIATRKKIEVRIGIRINPSMCNDSSTAIKMGGVPSQFGIEESSINQCINEILKNSNLTFMGIHTYTGTQVLSYEKIIQSMKYTLQLAENIREQFNIEFKFIDLGGGFGVKYFENQQDFDFLRFADEYNKLIINHKKSNPSTIYILESGRFLLAPFGYYVTKVNYVKESKGKKFAVVDGGLNHHQASTFRGRFMRNNYPIEKIKTTNKEIEQKEKVSIVGPLCTPEDCIGNDVLLPKLEVDDYIVIKNSGAYGYTYSPVYFLSHESPYEILFMQNKEYILRGKIDYNKILEEQVIISFKEYEDDKSEREEDRNNMPIL